MRLLSTLAALLLCPALPAGAQGTAKFPERDKTLKIVVPFAAGGGVDNAARLLGEQLRKQLGLTVIVENKAGASGSIGGKAVQTAPADGYTLLFSAATHVLAKQVLSSPPYDPQTDFAPVARVGEAPLMLVIAPQLPERSLAEVLAAAKAKPESWMAAIPAAGAPSHLATLLLAQQGGVKFSYVPYKGTQPALVDVGGGHVNLLMDSMISLLPLAKSGKVRPIAITSTKRSPLAPEVPTVQESGLAKFAYTSWYGVWAPKDTPADRIATLNGAINQAVTELGRSGAYASLGIDPVNESVEQFRRFVAADVAQGAELLKNAGYRPE
ncbi:Bug family tripartite tricarboxylate transporter substrate binding protein [Piscinibacter defluvii]|uniref:Bug family tripartite tricarboxylate transporter substrate binding protein n=1 Tax=Piscinibacter defluvii TaxID=1796922 RepID=UPI000FDDA43B|nr:tripartite tricarboxylate transporter substrate binding protein [Piscinibacter defluvii]